MGLGSLPNSLISMAKLTIRGEKTYNTEKLDKLGREREIKVKAFFFIFISAMKCVKTTIGTKNWKKKENKCETQNKQNKIKS